MYAKHFFKMLLGLLGMALIGVAGLLVINYYSKNPASTSGSGTTAGASQTTTN